MKHLIRSKLLIIILMTYFSIGLLFYLSDLKAQQQGFICPNSFNPSIASKSTEELIQYSEKVCVRNRSKFDTQEVIQAIYMITLWLPMIGGRTIYYLLLPR